MEEDKSSPLRSRLRRNFAERVIPIAFCLSVVGISGVGLLAYYLLARSQESEAWVLHTTIAIARLEALHKTLVEAESAGRAFLVTGEPGFRASFTRTLTLIDSELYQFRDFTSDNPSQQQLAKELEQYIGTRFAALEGQVRLRASAGFEALQATTLRAGAEEMRRISATVGQMKALENRLLAERTGVHKQRDDYLKYGLAVLIVAGIAVMATMFRFISRLWKERQAAEEYALRLAQHDALTGLPNRRLLSDRIEMGLAHARRYDGLLAVLCLDLDGFKLVNDVHGHDGGDALLRLVAQRLQDTVRAVDTVARTGGDEFVLVLAGVKEAAYAETAASKIIDRVSKPYTLSGEQVSVGTSIGIALYPIHGSTAGELLKRADEALYEAKRRGKLRYEVAAASPASHAGATVMEPAM